MKSAVDEKTVHQLGFDLRGRVKNTHLAPSNALLPLFEAIVNSMQAHDDAIKQENRTGGAIKVTIIRDDTQQKMFPDSDREIRFVKSMIIEDEGIGFNHDNYHSFCTSDSTHKEERGGKGIGRFLWLKAFERVEIQSVYHDVATEELRQREFRLSLKAGGVVGGEPTPALTNAPIRTVVSLFDMKRNFREGCRHKTSTIAKRILEHCIQFFVTEGAPDVVISDTEDGEPISLRDYFREEVLVRSEKPIPLPVDYAEGLGMTHLLLRASSGFGQSIFYCADDRVVRSSALTQRNICNLPAVLDSTEHGKVLYSGLVRGKYLDDRVLN